MNDSTRKKRCTPRSRSGCLPCRRHHRKCDEQRPVCDVCRSHGRTCQYGLRITWGGRPFRRSTFGQCMSGTTGQSTPVVRIQTTHADSKENSRPDAPFVYGIAEPMAVAPAAAIQPEPLPEPSAGGLCGQELQISSEALVVRHQGRLLPPMVATPSFLPGLPSAYKSLLDYFTHAVDSFSCDEVVKRDFCATFMPMAADTSHVMASMLNLAAVHRINAGLTQSSKQLALLQVVAVEQLRSRLSDSVGYPTEATMATILMLCYAEVVAGGKKAHSWRLHLEGAASLFNSDLSAWSMQSDNPTRAFIARCFVSIVALASMSGSPPGDSISEQALHMAGGKNRSQRIDEFTAYSADLFHVFVEIGALVKEREHALVNTELHSSASLEQRCSELIWKLRVAAQTRHSNMGSGLLATLLPARREEYININESYHQAAMLHIYQRVRRLPSSANEIQEIVHRILTLVSGVELLNGPCPGIVLLFPLFSAGCGAVKTTDRQQVRNLLGRMVGMYQIVTVRHSMKVLETLWAHRDEYGESNANVSWEDFVDRDIDLILY